MKQTNQGVQPQQGIHNRTPSSPFRRHRMGWIILGTAASALAVMCAGAA